MRISVCQTPPNVVILREAHTRIAAPFIMTVFSMQWSNHSGSYGSNILPSILCIFQTTKFKNLNFWRLKSENGKRHVDWHGKKNSQIDISRDLVQTLTFLISHEKNCYHEKFFNFCIISLTLMSRQIGQQIVYVHELERQPHSKKLLSMEMSDEGRNETLESRILLASNNIFLLILHIKNKVKVTSGLAMPPTSSKLRRCANDERSYNRPSCKNDDRQKTVFSTNSRMDYGVGRGFVFWVLNPQDVDFFPPRN